MTRTFRLTSCAEHPAQGAVGASHEAGDLPLSKITLNILYQRRDYRK
jgi:hypothetical protein